MGKKYYKKYYYKKGKWSANIITINSRDLVASQGNFYITQELAKNPLQSNSTISQQYTVKNVELNFELSSLDEAYINGLVLYIVFAPQGMTVSYAYANEHPEYIMAYRFIGRPNYNSPTSQPQQIGRNAIKVKSRLSRRLQTGDRLVLLIVGRNEYTSNSLINLDGIFRWWTKAN